MSHPYRPDDAQHMLQRELERCFRAHRQERWRHAIRTTVTQALLLAGGIALGLAHWAGWILVALLGLMAVSWYAMFIITTRHTARIQRRLAEAPGELAWLHLEATGSPTALRIYHLQLRDGTLSWLHLSPDMASSLTEAAAPHARVTRGPEARAAFEAEPGLRRVESMLQRDDSSLAVHLAPQILPMIAGRSCAELPAAKLASLRTAVEKLESLLGASVKYDAYKQRARERAPEVHAFLDSRSPATVQYADEAAPHVGVVQDAFGASSAAPSK